MPQKWKASDQAELPLLMQPTMRPEELLHEPQVHQVELEMQNEELRRAQVALETAHDRFVDLYDFAPVGYLTLNAQGMIVEANLTATGLLGKERRQLLKHAFVRLVTAEDSHRWHLYFRDALKREDPSRIELTLKTRDDHALHVQLDSVRVMTQEAVPLLRITLTDIGERKAAEAELRIAAAAFETQEGIMITDANWVILRVNRAFSDITGYCAEEAIGKTPSLVHSGLHDESFYEAIRESVNCFGLWQGEVLSRRKNDKVYPEWLTITAVTDQKKKVTQYVYTMVDISQRKSWEEINQLAFYDALTLLPNRRLLMDRLHQVLATSARTRLEGALMFIDLDHFKTLNDTHGHDKGDLLLLQVAQRLTECARAGDTVARLGGDEFVLMLADLSEHPVEAAAQAKTAGEKIVAELRKPYQLAGHEYHSTASIGIVLFGDRQYNAAELLKQADLTMYQAKAAGRNTMRFFDGDGDVQAAVSIGAALKYDLRQGVLGNQFLLYFQPQMDDHQHITGVEALVRWQHPQRGLILPSEFIPLAEDSGLIESLGQWVLNMACAQLSQWATRPATAHLTLAINISALQFRQPDFVERVITALERAGADPKKLKLELTESVMLDDVEGTIEKMATLTAHGVGLSLDDFGTGYSSLSYLKRLPLGQLKIDKSFIHDVLTNRNDAAIACTVLTLGHTLGLAVIAEGVETEAQREFLGLHGCHGFQGYLFSRPMPLKEFEQHLGNSVPF
ncbi:MAG: phosphodiesterase [Burkholderiaceae bacterium]|nr:MAG: phosphodiesterase [Burkholderiaceae bacterium]